MTGRLTQEMKCKIAVSQKAEGSGGELSASNRKFRINSAPTRRTIYAIHRKFMATGSVVDTQRSERLRSGHSKENIQELEEAYVLSQGKSIRRATVELDITRSSI